jgi:hypothetical protein
MVSKLGSMLPTEMVGISARSFVSCRGTPLCHIGFAFRYLHVAVLYSTRQGAKFSSYHTLIGAQGDTSIAEVLQMTQFKLTKQGVLEESEV